MKTTRIVSMFAVVFGLCFVGCNTVTNPTETQVTTLCAAARTVMAMGTNAAVSKNPEAKEYMLALADMIKVMAQKGDYDPQNLTQVVGDLAGRYGGTYGALASLAVQGGVTLYKRLYAANVDSKLDTAPAYRAVLLALSEGIKDGVSSAPANRTMVDLEKLDYKLR